jgi:CheY-like chemotaxis protein
MRSNGPVLYAEDDENDAFLMRHAFNQAKIINPLLVVSDGNAAIEYLLGKGGYSERKQHPLPCLVLLDLKMRGRSGLDVLKWKQDEPSLSTLPVLMLTSSSQERDIREAYELGANGYLLKPNTPDEMVSLAKAIKDFWLNRNLSIRL